MDTSNFKNEVLTRIKEEGFGLTNSARAVNSSGKYDLDILFRVAELDSDMTLKEVALQVIEDAKVLECDPGFTFSTIVQQLGSVIEIYASKE